MKIKNKVIVPIIFIIVEIILGIMVQTTRGSLNTTSSFLVVIFAFLFSLLMFKKKKFFILLSLALMCTVFADLFLVVLKPMKQVLAMFFFSITQICYFFIIYFNQNNLKEKKIHIVIRSIVIIIALLLTFIILKENTNLLSLISLFYYANLIMNIVFSFRMDNKSLIFSIGLILFACCDLLIGLDIMDSSFIQLKEGTILYFLANPGFNLAWMFYVPSQMLLGLYSTQIDKLTNI